MSSEYYEKGILIGLQMEGILWKWTNYWNGKPIFVDNSLLQSLERSKLGRVRSESVTNQKT